MAMALRVLALLLALSILALQYPLWIGKGSWLRVWEADRLLVAQREANDRMARRNAALDAEVRDLKEGYEAIEERARSELGLVKSDEVFIQVLGPKPSQPALPDSAAGRVPATPGR
jgi:cell division protein FtsB